MSDGRKALDAVAEWLRSQCGGLASAGRRTSRRSRRGPRFANPVIVESEVLAELHRLSSFAPRRQPYNLAAIEAAAERLPEVPRVACFDRSFHRGQPEVGKVVPLPREVVKNGVQRYGFQGLSYEYIVSVLPPVAPEIAPGKVIIAHLGSGASLCAVKDIKSADSTLGFTALDGLCMGNRPGPSIPAPFCYLFQKPRAHDQRGGNDSLQEVRFTRHFRNQQ